MPIQLMDGFDQLPGAEKVKDALVSLGYTFSGSGTPEFTTGRLDGSQAVLLPQNDKRVGLERNVRIDNGKLVIGFAMYATERARLLSINGDLLVLDWKEDGLRIGTQVSIARPIRNRWYYIELVLIQASLEVELYINGDQDITAALPTKLASAKTADLQFGGYNPTNVTGKPAPTDGTIVKSDLRIDDLYVGDELLNPISIITRFPTEDAQVEFEASVPGVKHFQLVTRNPPDPGQFVTSYKTGSVDLFRSSGAIPADATIRAVGLTFLARKGDIDERAMGMIVGDAEKVVKDLTLENRYYTRVFETDGAGKPWTPEGLSTATFGVAVR